jgi:hypothetical protein
MRSLHRNRAAATGSSFGVAANVKLVLARRVQRAVVRQRSAMSAFGGKADIGPSDRIAFDAQPARSMC